MAAAATIEGYLADTLYPSRLHQVCLPTWTDACMLASGVAPPRAHGRDPFVFVDLGCGDGFGIIAMAAAHPEGRFVGYDLMQSHVEAGNALVRELGIGNVEIRQGSFSQIEPDVSADYVTAHGVLTWVGPAAQAALINIAARLLKPGGVFSMSYNAMPGWQSRIPFQRLLRALSDGVAGDGRARFAAAFERVKASGAIAPQVIDNIEKLREVVPASYFPHEFLHEHWDPLWSGDVIRRAGESGLVWAGQAAPNALFPRFSLRARERAALEMIGDIPAKQIATDLFLNTSFRADMFMRPPISRLATEGIARRRLESCWLAVESEAAVVYQHDGPAGLLKFDNAAARAILRHLEDGPAPLMPLAAIGEANLINTLDVLFLAGLVRPAAPEAPVPHAARLNARVSASHGSDRPMNGMTGAHGALRLGHADYIALGPAGLRRFGIR